MPSAATRRSDGDGHAAAYRRRRRPDHAKGAQLPREMSERRRSGPRWPMRSARHGFANTSIRASARRLSQAGATWNDRRVLIFTEYDRHQALPRTAAPRGAPGTDSRRTAHRGFHVPTPREKRDAIKRAFNPAPWHPLRIFAPTRRAKASTCRTTVTTSSTSTCRGTLAAWSSATAASTASSEPEPVPYIPTAQLPVAEDAVLVRR